MEKFTTRTLPVKLTDEAEPDAAADEAVEEASLVPPVPDEEGGTQPQSER